MSRLLAILMSAIVFAAAMSGCAGDPGGGGDDAATQQTEGRESVAAAEQHASADAVPGSYEDWCGEHGVPESACTRCNPSLIPAFKATNDWCAEHNLPESQCKACNPDLVIARPPKPEGARPANPQGD